MLTARWKITGDAIVVVFFSSSVNKVGVGYGPFTKSAASKLNGLRRMVYPRFLKIPSSKYSAKGTELWLIWLFRKTIFVHPWMKIAFDITARLYSNVLSFIRQELTASNLDSESFEISLY